MFTRDFKEKELREIELPGKHVDDFVELLHCMYPPIKPVTGKGIVTLSHICSGYCKSRKFGVQENLANLALGQN